MNTIEHPTQCVCAQRCDRALSWLSRAPMAQCCEDGKCDCWCHEQGDKEADRGKQRSIWRNKGAPPTDYEVAQGSLA